MTAAALIRIVDDDRDLCESLAWSLKQAGLRSHVFATGDELLDDLKPETPGCILLDLCMPQMSGIDVQRKLSQRGVALPVIFMSAQAQVRQAVEAMLGGAVDFIEKPASREHLLSRIRDAVARDRNRRGTVARDRQTIDRLEKLTPREREVFEHVVNGDLSKQIARKLDISPRTVEVHRSHIMLKIECQSIAELVHLSIDYKRALRRSANRNHSMKSPGNSISPQPDDSESESPDQRSQD